MLQEEALLTADWGSDVFARCLRIVVYGNDVWGRCSETCPLWSVVDCQLGVLCRLHRPWWISILRTACLDLCRVIKGLSSPKRAECSCAGPQRGSTSKAGIRLLSSVCANSNRKTSFVVLPIQKCYERKRKTTNLSKEDQLEKRQRLCMSLISVFYTLSLSFWPSRAPSDKPNS